MPVEGRGQLRLRAGRRAGHGRRRLVLRRAEGRRGGDQEPRRVLARRGDRPVSGERVALGASYPTPLEPAPRLAERIGLGPEDLWVKRDDLTALAGGGNKVRKLEYLCAKALADGATVLVTSGGPQSNHSRLTAAAARRLGLKATLVLAADGPGTGNGNLALDALLGAEVVWAGRLDPDALDAVVATTAEDVRARGERPAVFPLGGSDGTGARGYVDCANELLEQAPGATTVVVALGSGGTMAGLVAGLGAERVLGVDVGAVDDPADRVVGVAGELGWTG